MAGDGRLVKMEVDYSDTVDKKLPECQEMARVGQSTDQWLGLLAFNIKRLENNLLS